MFASLIRVWRVSRSWALAVVATTAALLVGACQSTVVISPCAEGQIPCDGGCVDPSSDADNCGDCGVECPSGVCSGGACAGACPPPATLCAGACTDTQSDRGHCGACGNACPAGLSCFQGACVDGCPLTECGDLCVDTSSNPAHCGGCFQACAPGQPCGGGVCGGECPPNTVNCGGTCADISFDPFHCGGCFITCGPGALCDFGSCVGACGPGLLECGGFCVNPLVDHQHCGGCFSPCDDDETCSQGSCVSGGCPGSACGICDVVTLPSTAPSSVVGTTAGAEHHYTPSCVGTSQPEVAHLFVAPQRGLYTFDTVGSTFDTILSVLGPGGCFEAICNDDAIGLASQVQVFLSAGDTIYVVVDGFTTGTYQLNVSLEPLCPPGSSDCNGECVDLLTNPDHCGACNVPCGSGDTCSMGMCTGVCGGPCGSCGAVVALPGSVPQTTTGSTVGAFDDLVPGCTGSPGPEILHSFTAPATGSYVFSTANSAYDTVLTVLDGASCAEIGCNDDFGGQQTSRVTASLTQGQTVYVVVDGQNASGFYSLFVNGTPSATCPTADLGGSVPVTVSGSTAGGANFFVPACSFGAAPEHTYTFTAPTTKVYTMDTFGSSYDTVLHVLGATCAGVSLACNDDTFGLQSQVTVSLTQGQVVTIVVDGYSSSSGSYVLNVQ